MRKQRRKLNEMLFNPKHKTLQCTDRQTLVCLAGLPSQEDVDLLFNPVLVIGGVCVGGLLVNQARKVGQLKY